MAYHLAPLPISRLGAAAAAVAKASRVLASVAPAERLEAVKLPAAVLVTEPAQSGPARSRLEGSQAVSSTRAEVTDYDETRNTIRRRQLRVVRAMPQGAPNGSSS